MFSLLNGYYLRDRPSIITLDPVHVPFFIYPALKPEVVYYSHLRTTTALSYLEYQVLITWPLTAKILSLLSPSKRPVECLLTMGGRVFSIACFF